MSRLTTKRKIGYECPENCNGVCGACDKWAKIISKLGQLEDLMEKYHCDDIRHLEQKLELDLIHQSELRKASYKLMSLENKLKNAIVPKFDIQDTVYMIGINNEILEGQIDVFDYYRKKYSVYFYGEDEIKCLGDEWCLETELFATKEEAEKKLEELKNDK